MDRIAGSLHGTNDGHATSAAHCERTPTASRTSLARSADRRLVWRRWAARDRRPGAAGCGSCARLRARRWWCVHACRHGRARGRRRDTSSHVARAGLRTRRPGRLQRIGRPRPPRDLGGARARDRALRACVQPRRQTSVPDTGSEWASVVLTPARLGLRRLRGTGSQDRNADGTQGDVACDRCRLRSRWSQTRRPPAVAVHGGWAGRRRHRHDVRLALFGEPSSPPEHGAVQVVDVQLPPSAPVPA